ncbi:unnamed protein product [Cuscuta epithymum]|uniref:Uncharacterized protein n=1 Tax=Cuscuta epithymum TaxID=186058 RepID=A0AAV0EHF8_9ASTE|nr:unnamed protein product [Cuscuta epithymum]
MDERNSRVERPRNEEAEGLLSSKVEVDVDRIIELIQSKLPESQKLISESAGRSQSSSSCCIFPVPQEGLPNSCVLAWSHEPRTVSIGPYHHGKPHLKKMEKHKVRFLNRVIKRTTENNGVGIEHYVKAVKELEAEARASYSEDTTTFNEDDFVAMLVLDGCFVIEMFRAYIGVVPFEADDPFPSMTRLQLRLRDDFLCLDNQIPYLVLQKLFELTQMGSDRLPGESRPSLPLTALHFFNRSRELGRSVYMIYLERSPVHLLDLLRKSYSSSVLPWDTNCILDLLLKAGTRLKSAIEESRLNCFPRTDWDSKQGSISKIPAVSKLEEQARIKLKLNTNARSFLQVEFKRGVIWMPRLELDYRMCAFLVNCVVFEQRWRGEDKSISEYVAFLDCLIDTHEDVARLWDANILRHSFPLHCQVKNFVGRLGKAAACDVAGGYLRDVFAGVNNDFDKHYADPWHVRWAKVSETHFSRYFSAPWKLTSVCAVIILFLLTTIQTIFTIMRYFKKEKTPE